MTAQIVPMRECASGLCPTGCSHLCWECNVCKCSGGFAESREVLGAHIRRHAMTCPRGTYTSACEFGKCTQCYDPDRCTCECHPVRALSHDPLCRWRGERAPWSVCRDCDRITKAREQAIRDCIETVVSIHSPVTYANDLIYCQGCADANADGWSFAWPCPVVKAVRALLEGTASFPLATGGVISADTSPPQISDGCVLPGVTRRPNGALLEEKP